MGSIGSSSFFARQDHQHSHGFLTNSLLHATATTSASGFLSNTDKAFIDALPASITSSLNSLSSTFSSSLYSISSSISSTIAGISTTVDSSSIVGTTLNYTSGSFTILSATYLSATHENINGDLILTGNFWLSGNINSFNNYNREVWVVPYSASAEANGTKFNPFNPVSAQAVGAVGPINQATHHLMNISNASTFEEQSPKIVHLYQGRYDENITISGSEPYQITYNGIIRIGNISGGGEQRLFTCTRITTPLTYSGLSVIPQFGIVREYGQQYGSFLYGGPLILITTGSVTTVCMLESTTFDSISSSLCTGSVVLSQVGGNYRGRVNFTGSSTVFKELDFSQDVDISGSNPVRLFEKCVFRAPLTLSMGYTSVPSGFSRGLLACEFKSGFTFSGPTGSAQFDLVTYRNFLTSSGVFIGGASTNDFLIPGTFASGTYTNFTATNFTSTTGNFLNLTATNDIQVNGILLSASVATSISTLSSSVSSALTAFSASEYQFITESLNSLSSSVYVYASQSLNSFSGSEYIFISSSLYSLSASFSSTIAATTKIVQIQVTDPNGSAITTGDGKAYFSIPSEINNYNLVNAQAALFTGSTSGVPNFQVRNTTTAADMLTTPITIDIGDNPPVSYTAATPPVIDTANDDVQTGELLAIDIDTAGTGCKGLMINLTFRLP